MVVKGSSVANIQSLEGKPVPGSRNPTPDNWPAEAKLAVVMETASLNEAELAEYCRAKCLYSEQIGRWKADVMKPSVMPTRNNLKSVM